MRYSFLHNYCKHFVKYCKMNVPRKRKAICVFISGSDNKQLGWIPRETISEVQRMDRMEDLKISLITFKEKEISVDFSKIDCVIEISSAEL